MQIPILIFVCCKVEISVQDSPGKPKKENNMDALTQQLLQQLAGEGVTQISRKIGADEQTTKAALSTALPLLVSALAKNTSKAEGAQSLNQALAKDHDGSILNDVPAYLENPATANGAGILGHVLGSQMPVVEKGLSKGTGLNSEQVGQLLQIAVPLLLGALGKQQQQKGLDPNGLSAYLGSQQQKDKDADPDLMGTLNTLLDADKDGSALDDVLGMAVKLFEKKS
jgi:hypothetical protein